MLISFLYACTYNKTYINREQDNDEGKAFLNKFYANVVKKNYKGVDSMVSGGLKQLAGINGISKMVKFIDSKVGKYKGYTIQDQYIRAVTGSTNEVSYNYKLKVTYDKGIIDEVVGFIKVNDGEIKINSYHANSDLLIQ